jgi:hypothetical protein
LTKKGKPSGKFASVPQCSERQLAAVVERGNCDGVLGTVLGDVPLPSEQKRSEMQALLKPAAGLRMHRWKMLQTMEMLSAGLCNLPGGVSGSQVLELQRLALLESDATALFGDDADLVKPVIERARRRRQKAMTGQREFHAYEALPKRE